MTTYHTYSPIKVLKLPSHPLQRQHKAKRNRRNKQMSCWAKHRMLLSSIPLRWSYWSVNTLCESLCYWTCHLLYENLMDAAGGTVDRAVRKAPWRPHSLSVSGTKSHQCNQQPDRGRLTGDLRICQQVQLKQHSPTWTHSVYPHTFDVPKMICHLSCWQAGSVGRWGWS